MNLIENDYEKALMLQLTPNARDLSEHLFSTCSLQQLLEMLYEKNLSDQYMKPHLSEELAQQILYATLLAKTTYFLPNPKMSKEECGYLITLACEVAGYTLKEYSLSEVITASKIEMPIFSDWLLAFEKLYIKL